MIFNKKEEGVSWRRCIISRMAMLLKEVVDVLILQVGRNRQQREKRGEHSQVRCFEGQRVMCVEVKKFGPMHNTALAKRGSALEIRRVNTLNFLKEKE